MFLSSHYLLSIIIFMNVCQKEENFVRSSNKVNICRFDQTAQLKESSFIQYLITQHAVFENINQYIDLKTFIEFLKISVSQAFNN